MAAAQAGASRLAAASIPASTLRRCFEKIDGSYDADRLVRFESQQIEIVGDDEVRVAGESAGEDVVVRRIFQCGW
jgi:hypothetical protein